MNDLLSPARLQAMDPDAWIAHLFSSKAARTGGVVRRKARDVERIVGWPRFRREVRARGFTALRNSGQVVVFCNAHPIRPL